MKKGDPCEQKGIFAGNEFCEIWTKFHGWFGWCIGPRKIGGCFGVSQNFGWSPLMVQKIDQNVWSNEPRKYHVPGFFWKAPKNGSNGPKTFEFALSEFGLKILWPRCKNPSCGAILKIWWLHFPSELPCILAFMEIQVSGKFGGDGQKVSLEEIHVVLKILEKTSTCYKTQ